METYTHLLHIFDKRIKHLSKIVFRLLQACDYCMRSLETAEEMCQRLTQKPSLTLPYPQCCQTDKTSYIKCTGCDVSKFLLPSSLHILLAVLKQTQYL